MAKALFCLHTILWINGFPKPNNKKQNTQIVQQKGYLRDQKVENIRFLQNTL